MVSYKGVEFTPQRKRRLALSNSAGQILLHVQCLERSQIAFKVLSFFQKIDFENNSYMKGLELLGLSIHFNGMFNIYHFVSVELYCVLKLQVHKRCEENVTYMGKRRFEGVFIGMESTGAIP